MIDEIYDSAPSQYYDAPTFDQYAMVHFEARGGAVHARVLLVADCRGVCVSEYHVGQALTVDYSPQAPSHAWLASSAGHASGGWLYPALALGLLAIVCFGAAVFNAVTV